MLRRIRLQRPTKSTNCNNDQDNKRDRYNYRDPGRSLSDNLLPASKDAAIHAVRPTTRPAERSVPVSTIVPAIPTAIGMLAADSEIIFTIDDGVTKFGFCIAV